MATETGKPISDESFERLLSDTMPDKADRSRKKQRKKGKQKETKEREKIVIGTSLGDLLKAHVKGKS